MPTIYRDTPASAPCDDCGATGKWVAGPITNGKPAHTGICFRCGGKGYKTPADVKRNRYYDNHVRRIGN